MNTQRTALIALAALVLLTTTAKAQPEVALCDAAWMDTERVRALLAVEFGGEASGASRIEVRDCDGDVAVVVVRFGDEDAQGRTRRLDLGQTNGAARSRLVALFIAELVRLGSHEGSEEMLPTPDAQGDGEADVLEGSPEALPPNASSDASTEEAEAETGTDVAEAVVVAEPVPEEDANEVIEPDRCDGWRTFGRGLCSWALSVGYGLAFHQLGILGESRTGSLFHHQLRLVGRWRYLLFGVRLFGGRNHVEFPVARDILVGGVTALAGLEWWARRWSKTVVALRTGIEAGIQGFRDDTGEARCGAFGDCFTAAGRPSFGAFTTFRIERAFGIVRGAFEVELGWATGFRVDDQEALVTGLGGPWISLNVDLSVGRAE